MEMLKSLIDIFLDVFSESGFPLGVLKHPNSFVVVHRERTKSPPRNSLCVTRRWVGGAALCRNIGNCHFSVGVRLSDYMLTKYPIFFPALTITTDYF